MLIAAKRSMKAQREQRRRHGARAVDPEDHAWRDLLKARPRAAAERALDLWIPGEGQHRRPAVSELSASGRGGSVMTSGRARSQR